MCINAVFKLLTLLQEFLNKYVLKELDFWITDLVQQIILNQIDL